MTETAIIYQCGACRRYFVDSEVVSVSFGEAVAAIRAGQLEQFVCGREDCAAVVEQNVRTDQERRARRAFCRKKHFRPAARGRHRPANCAAHPACPPDPPLPRRSAQGPDLKEREQRPEVCATGAEYGAPVAPSQEEFESSGAAANQNAKLIEFFSDPRTHGKMWPMVYLQEISGAQRMNNRAIDLRKHFKPLGFGLWNEMLIYKVTGAMHSHYGLFTLEEIRLKEEAWAADQEQRRGQERLV
jgi:hypothetical protein